MNIFFKSLLFVKLHLFTTLLFVKLHLLLFNFVFQNLKRGGGVCGEVPPILNNKGNWEFGMW